MQFGTKKIKTGKYNIRTGTITEVKSNNNYLGRIDGEKNDRSFKGDRIKYGVGSRVTIGIVQGYSSEVKILGRASFSLAEESIVNI